MFKKIFFLLLIILCIFIFLSPNEDREIIFEDEFQNISKWQAKGDIEELKIIRLKDNISSIVLIKDDKPSFGGIKTKEQYYVNSKYSYIISFKTKVDYGTLHFAIENENEKRKVWGGINNKIWQSKSIIYNPKKSGKIYLIFENAFSGENKNPLKSYITRLTFLKK